MNTITRKIRVQNQAKGFTIIEVVLVLAIAGLIFLIVFLALPGLQRSRRDTQRKSDLQKFVADIQSYSSNNSGRIPYNGGCDNPYGNPGITAPKSSDTTAKPTNGTSSHQPTIDMIWDYFKKDQNGDPSGGNYAVVSCGHLGGALPGIVYVSLHTQCESNNTAGRIAKWDPSYPVSASAADIKLENGSYYCITV